MRAALLAVMIAGVVCPPPTADARTSSAKIKKSKNEAKAKAKARAKAKAKRKKKPKKAKQVSRIPTRSSLRNTKNMPRGYVWPPTRQMLAAEKACRAELDARGIAYKPAWSEGRIVGALTISEGADDGALVLGGITYHSAWRKGPHKLDCQLARVLDDFGPTLHDLGVREVTFGSIYRWTNVRVNGKTKNILSRHALGIAMDIVSFTDEAGRVANGKKDYPADDPLLHAIEDAVNTSHKFRTLLTPKNDPVSHSDHFHIEAYVDYTAPAS
jgi:hypothetical protein